MRNLQNVLRDLPDPGGVRAWISGKHSPASQREGWLATLRLACHRCSRSNHVVAWLWRVDGVIEMAARAMTSERANQKSR